MVGPALRSFAVAGVLVVTVVAGGVPAAAPVFAQPGDSEPSSQGTDSPDSDDGTDGSGDTGGSDPAPDDPGPAAEPEGPSEPPTEDTTGTVGDKTDPEPAGEPDGGSGGGDSGGRNGAVIDAPAPPPPPPPPAPRTSGITGSIKIPFFRLPAAGEIPPGSWPTASTFYTTVAIPVPTLGDFLRALSVVPAPAPPPPGPAFRIQEEAPVADASTGTTTAGVVGTGGGGMAGPVVFRAPLVTVPRATTVAGRPARAGQRTAADPAVPGAAPPGVAGVATPAIRGSVRPTPGATAPASWSPTSGQTPPSGLYARGASATTLAEIAAVALPGVAGLLFLTFSGGMIGYRQANSVRYVRTAGAERFLP